MSILFAEAVDSNHLRWDEK